VLVASDEQLIHAPPHVVRAASRGRLGLLARTVVKLLDGQCCPRQYDSNLDLMGKAVLWTYSKCPKYNAPGVPAAALERSISLQTTLG
jgi:hypothetical protein